MGAGKGAVGREWSECGALEERPGAQEGAMFCGGTVRAGKGAVGLKMSELGALEERPRPPERSMFGGSLPTGQQIWASEVGEV